MERIRNWATGIALLTLAACNPQRDTTSANNAVAPGKTAATPVTKPLPEDKTLRKLLIGAWVTSDKRPTGDPEDLCATDNGIFLDADGSYSEYNEAGRWIVKDGVLVITATTALPDFDEEGQTEKPINPPRVMRWSLLELDGKLVHARTESGHAWMFRCPTLAKV